MSKFYKFLAILLLVATTTFGAETRSMVFRNGNMRTINKLSKDEKKPIMVYVGGQYCGQSMKMNEVFQKQEVVNYFSENFVCKSLEASNIFNQLKAAGWGVTAIPSYVFMTANGKIVHMASGYRKPEKMIEEAQTALDKMRDQNNRPGAE